MPKMTDEQIGKILGALEAGASKAMAARIAGINKTTINVRAMRDPKFRAMVDDAIAMATDRVEEALWRRAMGGSVAAMIFWLKNKRPLVWKDRHEHGVITGSNVTVTLKDDRADGSGET